MTDKNKKKKGHFYVNQWKIEFIIEICLCVLGIEYPI